MIKIKINILFLPITTLLRILWLKPAYSKIWKHGGVIFALPLQGFPCGLDSLQSTSFYLLIKHLIII